METAPIVWATGAMFRGVPKCSKQHETGTAAVDETAHQAHLNEYMYINTRIPHPILSYSDTIPDRLVIDLQGILESYGLHGAVVA